jgi:DNA invertase Pin-like site-specific DNA recombinase
MPKKNIALYLRVSTRDQSFASQEKDLRDYCRRRGWKHLRIYSEKASGVKAARTVLGNLMTDARAGMIETIVVYKLDRLGRSLNHLLQIITELARIKIGLIVPSQGIDTSNGSHVADLQLNVLGAVAQFEREMIRDRTLSGVASARKRGKILGRPGTSQEKIDLVLKLRGVKEKGRTLTLTTIAQRSGVSLGQTWKILNDPKYQKPKKLVEVFS